ncbi:MAG: hypothetical protein ACM3PE_05740 [Deltaproteobacteria bacterium]
MSIRSVDMQVLVQKTGDIARIQAANQVEGQHKLMENTQNINVQNENIARRVNDPLRNESKLVHEKEEQEKNQKKRQRQQEGEEETRKDKEAAKNKGKAEGNHHLDITI